MEKEINDKIDFALHHGIRAEDLRLYMDRNAYSELAKEISERARFIEEFPPTWAELCRQHHMREPNVPRFCGVQIIPTYVRDGWKLTALVSKYEGPGEEKTRHIIETAKQICETCINKMGGNSIFDDENGVVLMFDGEKLWTSKVIFLLDGEGMSWSTNGIRGPWNCAQ